MVDIAGNRVRQMAWNWGQSTFKGPGNGGMSESLLQEMNARGGRGTNCVRYRVHVCVRTCVHVCIYLRAARVYIYFTS